MARIGGVDVPNNKRLVISLTYIFGIGKPTAEKICQEANVNPDTRVGDLTNEELDAVRSVVSHQKIEGDLRRDISMDIKRLQDIGSYRGMRHRRNLPVRGQNTKNNARTRKGPKKPVR